MKVLNLFVCISVIFCFGRRLCDFGGATSLEGASTDLTQAFYALDLRAFAKLIDDVLTSLIITDMLSSDDRHIRLMEQIRILLLGAGDEGPSLCSLTEVSFQSIHQMLVQAISAKV